jgi:S-adenosyl-L-methionine hydrolase (adenosine-forming)
MAIATQAAPVISFLSDYGLEDEFVGVCHGVIARRCPEARVIDITHAIPPQDVSIGALVLRDSLAYMPAGVHLAVVDPTVGRPDRRAVAIRCGERALVGPDNGLLWLAAEKLGGPDAAVDVGGSPERLNPVSSTFHGRDVFAPVAAALACGLTLTDVGEEIEVSGLRALALPEAEVREGAVVAHVLRSDRYGNLILDASFPALAQVGIEAGGAFTARAGERALTGRHGDTFADVGAGALLLYMDASRMAALAVNGGSAATALAARPGAEIVLRSV